MSADIYKQFEADLDPELGCPRLRFNFDNGWAASLLIRGRVGDFGAMLASVAAAPRGEWGTGVTELGPTEAFADEAVAWIDAVRLRPELSLSGKRGLAFIDEMPK